MGVTVRICTFVFVIVLLSVTAVHVPGGCGLRYIREYAAIRSICFSSLCKEGCLLLFQFLPASFRILLGYISVLNSKLGRNLGGEYRLCTSVSSREHFTFNVSWESILAIFKLRLNFSHECSKKIIFSCLVEYPLLVIVKLGYSRIQVRKIVGM